jgi:hypothetical protein
LSVFSAYLPLTVCFLFISSDCLFPFHIFILTTCDTRTRSRNSGWLGHAPLRAVTLQSGQTGVSAAAMYASQTLVLPPSRCVSTFARLCRRVRSVSCICWQAAGPILCLAQAVLARMQDAPGLTALHSVPAHADLADPGCRRCPPPTVSPAGGPLPPLPLPSARAARRRLWLACPRRPATPLLRS